MRYLLGVDVGSYSTKASLLSSDGTLIATATRAHAMQVPAPGRAEHDAQAVWWDGFKAVSAQVLQTAGVSAADIAGVGCSGIGPCMLPLDDAAQPLRAAVLYGIDTRAEQQIDVLTKRYGTDLLMQACGGALTTQAVGPKVLWLQNQEPQVFANTAHIVGCTTFLVQRLTGNFVVDHYSASTHLPFYDIHHLRWDVQRVQDTCPPGWLPDIGWTTDIGGHITREAALQTGLAEGTPVVVGTIDSAAEAMSVGVQRSGDLMVQYGTTMFFIQVIDALHNDARHWSAPYLFPGTWAAMGGMSGGGGLTHWFAKLIASGPTAEPDFAALAAAAAHSPPGARGLIVLPYFSGERTPINDPKACGMVFGLNLHHSQADLYRAVLEGIGHATRHNIDMLREISPCAVVDAVGGGVHNAVWLQASADITGTPQRIRQHTIGASMGSAFLAGIGVGAFQAGDIDRINPVVRDVQPQSQWRGLYDADHRTYQALYEATRHIMHSRAV